MGLYRKYIVTWMNLASDYIVEHQIQSKTEHHIIEQKIACKTEYHVEELYISLHNLEHKIWESNCTDQDQWRREHCIQHHIAENQTTH